MNAHPNTGGDSSPQAAAPAKPTIPPERPEKIALVLGSGSARGWAHIGILQALEELAIRIDCVVGSSIGALVGAVYASRGIEQLKEVVVHLDRRQLLSLLDVGLRHAGLIDGKRVADELREQIRQPEIQSLSLPFRAVATDLNTGEEVLLDRGDVIEAVRASISIPGVFTPVVRGERLLVDGGLTNPVPVSLVRAWGADFVIAVDVNHDLLRQRSSREQARKRAVEADGGDAGQDQEDGRDPARDGKADGEATKDGQPDGRAAQDGKEEDDGAALPHFLRDLRRMIRDDVVKRNSALAYLNRQMDKIHLPDLAPLKAAFDREDAPSILEVIFTSTAIMEARIGDYRLQIDRPDLLIRPRVGDIRGHEFDRGEEAIAEGYRAALKALRPLQETWWPLDSDRSRP